MTKLDQALSDCHRIAAQFEKLHTYSITFDSITDALLWLTFGIVLGSLL
ncbi:hypothetical protein V2P20_02810 [Methylobacter sp. Wu1]